MLEGPDPTDLHVGQRVGAIRAELGLTQSDLARHLGISFQQVQKYEKGANRISASKLWELAGLFKVEVAAFFQGLQGGASPESQDSPRPQTAATVEIAKLVVRLPIERQRLAANVIRALAE